MTNARATQGKENAKMPRVAEGAEPPKLGRVRGAGQESARIADTSVAPPALSARHSHKARSLHRS